MVLTSLEPRGRLAAGLEPGPGLPPGMEIETVPHEQIAQFNGDVVGFILITGRPAFAVTVGLVRRLRRQRRSAAILVGPVESDACEVLHLVDAGADDFVSLPCTASEWHVRLCRAAEARRPMEPPWRPGVPNDRAGPPAAADESFREAKARVAETFERDDVEQLPSVHSGNVTHAAHAARKDRRAFFELTRKYRSEPKRFRTVNSRH